MLSLLYSAAVLAADEINLRPEGGLAGDLTSLTVGGIVTALIRLILVIAALVFFFILVIGGIRWTAAAGDKAQTEAARNQITAALVGLVIVFAAWSIIQLINTFFGVNIFELSLPTANP